MSSERRYGSSKRYRDDDDRRDYERGYRSEDRSARRRVVDDRRYSDDYYDDYYGRGYDRVKERSRFEDERSRYDDERGRHEDERPRYKDERPRYKDDERSRYEGERDWKCKECGVRNYEVDVRCDRCGARGPRYDSRRRSDRSGGRRSDDSRSGGRRNEDETDKRGSKEWPTPFESGGAEYVFDARSGMFYESLSDFFYDPKSKLYFGNLKKIYYEFCPGEDPPFSAVRSTQEEGTDVTVGTETTVGRTPEGKKKIAISLKTTTLPGESDNTKSTKKSKGSARKKTKVATAPTVKRAEKQHAANMEKWSERGKEIRDENEPSTKNLPITSKGQPVCLLCRRKFASVEKLKLHEELSALHKENLAKKEADEMKKQEAELSAEYRDRALERRIMHGPEASSLPALPRDLDVSTKQETDVVRPEDNLGAANIGNQMLQKLGWSAGASLGRSDGDAPKGEGAGQASAQKLVKDWEKIESLAAVGQQPRANKYGSEGGLGSGL